MKKFLSLVLALVMALSLTTVAWGADPVAKIGDTPYDTVAAALANVQNGETITIVQNASGDESGTEIDFIRPITFTITGNAPDYKMPIITFAYAGTDGGKIVVNIEGATLTFAELDARQNATINVKNSTIYDKGSNDIVKSYYNGAINIINSTVDTMQLTTTGYINISSGSVVNVTWQTNVYENGLITIDATSTLNTAAFNLTGKAYNNRGNTERAGMPAEVIVDGGELNIGCDDVYGYHVGMYGINIGTENAAELTIQNGAEVNMEQYTEGTNSYAYAGEITVGTKGTINVEDGTLNVAKSDSGTGDVALNVEGKMNVAEDAAVNSSITEIAVSGTLKSAGDISGEISKETNGTIEVTGGTYTDDVSDYVAGDYVQGGDGSVVTPVAQVGSTKYATLAEAVAAAPAGGTVTLLRDCDDDVTVGKALTFDFNGYTYSGVITPAAGYTYMDGVVKKTPAASGTTSTGSVTSGTVTPGKAKLYLLATAGTSMTELSNVTKIELTTTSGKLVNDVPVYVPDIYKLDGVFYVEVAKADATHALKNNGAYVYLVPAGTAGTVDAVIAKFATTVVLDQYVAAAEDVECGDAVKGTKGAAIYKSGTDAYYADGSNWAVFKGEFVTYDKNTKVAYKEHKWDAKSIIVKATDVKGTKVPVTIECEDCEKTFSIVPSAKFDNTWVKGVNYTTDTAVDKYNTAAVKYYIVLNDATYTGGTYVPSVPSTDKVQSADTFDAGIAMYVGMSVMAAAGSAVVIGKKKD